VTARLAASTLAIAALALSGCEEEAGPGPDPRRSSREEPASRAATGSAPAAAVSTTDLADGTDIPSPTGRPSFLLITLDTVRADRLGSYGASPSPTPTLDSLAQRGVLFESAIATNPETLPSHASILTGLYPSAHGVRSNGRFALSEQGTLVSEVLARNGWRTGAFVASVVLERRYGLAQGFGVYTTPGDASPDSEERPADEVVDDAITWLRGIGPDERYFAWVHLFDAHHPYEPPEPWRSRIEDAYSGEIAFADSQVKRLLRSLSVRGLDRNLITIVTADHGESLGEHGEGTHAYFIYQSTMHVPLLVSGAGIEEYGGTRVAEAVSVAQVAPTILSLAGIAAKELPAAVLAPLLGPDGSPQTAEAEQAIYLESLYPYYAFGLGGFRGIVQRGEKLVRGQRRELYSLARDPAERVDRAEEEPTRADRLEALLSEIVAEHAPLEWATAVHLSDRERAALETLGYVLPSGREGDPFDPTLADPIAGFPHLQEALMAQTRLREAALLLRGDPRNSAAQDRERRHQGERELESLRDLLIEALESNPRNSTARFLLARCEVLLGNFDAAIPTLESRIAALPWDQAAHYHLALAYAGVGRGREAAERMERAVEIGPPFPLYLEWLVDHHRRAGDRGAAVLWAERYLASADAQHRQAAKKLLDEVRAEVGSEPREE
jgi:arylsulfatase A-like enzyme